ALAGCGDSGMDTDSSTATGVTQPTSPTTTTMTGTTVGTESSTDSDAGTETSQGSTDTQATTDSTTAGTETTPVTDSDSDSDSDPTDTTDTGGCPLKCSADLTAVVDCNNEIIDPCDGDEGCDAETLQCTSPCGAAEQSGSSVGCEYYATLMHTFEENPCFAAFVANTWDSPAHISVEYDGAPLDVGAFTYLPDGAGPNLVYDPYDDVGGLPPGQVAILLLAGPDGMDVCPYPTAMPVGPSVLGTGTGASFRITTDVPVVAYQINPYGGGSAAVTGASLLLPTSVWDDNYVVVNAYSYFAPRVPSFNVVAREDNTQVTLQPVVDVIGGGGLPSGGAGQSLMFSLDAGEHAQFSQIEELTGSIIKADKPVGLMGGHECMRVPSGEMWCDHGEQMIPPVRALGNEYVGVMHRPRNGEDSFWRIVGAVDGTQLTWSNNVGGPATLSQGQLVEFITGTPFVVSSQDEDHPFLLFNIMSGNGWVPGPEGYGDPDFVISYPPEQYGNYYVFFADPTYPETNLVVVRSRDMGGFHDVNLDCAGPLNGWQAVGQDYEWTRIDLITGDFEDVGNCSTGPHIMESDGRFGVWVWGWGTPETTIKTTNVSYGYPGGMNVKLINDLVLIPE
ncbi:MAG: IgGFc-binding protein, partial [Myxococcales bacterium]|nr:IgGFc-binding protein [Myxococcales bacterium]